MPRLRLSVLLLVVACIACGKSSEDARKDLAMMNIEYSEDAFLDRIRKGDVIAVKLFLTAQMSPDTKDNQGLTALMWASYQGKSEIVKTLLDKGADVNAPGGSSLSGGITTALLCAVGGFLEQDGGNRAEVVKMLLDKGADVNVRLKNLRNMEDGNTALLAMSFYVSSPRRSDSKDCLEIVRLLLENGADVNAKGWRGKTALIAAATCENNDIVKMLLDKGADVNAKDVDGKTALGFAQVEKNVAIVDLLRKAGAKE